MLSTLDSLIDKLSNYIFIKDTMIKELAQDHFRTSLQS
jgi:hypothetical protein